MYLVYSEILSGHSFASMNRHAQDLQVGSVVPQQMGGEVLAHAVLLSTDQADVLVVNLEPAVNLPRHLGGEEALLAMPALLRS